MSNGINPSAGSPRPKFGMIVPTFPTGTLTNALYTVDVAADTATLQFKDYGTALPGKEDHKLISISGYVSNENKAWNRYTFATIPGTSQLGSVMLPSGYVGTTSSQRVNAGTVAESGALIIDSTVTNESDASSIRTTTVSPVLFGSGEYTTSITKNIPEMFLSQIGRETTAITVDGVIGTGDAASFQALATGEIDHSETQLTKWVKRVVSTMMDLSLLPLSLSGTERQSDFGGVLANVTTTLSTTVQTQSAETDSLAVLAFSSVSLGSGLFMTVQKSINTGVLPGPVLESTKKDLDGATITTQRNLVVADAITTAETLGSVTTKDDVTASKIIAWKVVISRAFPGILVTNSSIAEDGATITITRQLKDASAITTGEAITGGALVKTTREPHESFSLSAWEVITSRPIPGNTVVSVTVDQANNLVTDTTIQKDASTITPSVTLADGLFTEVSKVAISDIVAEEKTRVRTLFTANGLTLEMLLPREIHYKKFTTTTTAIVAGTAWALTDMTPPVLGTGEILHSEKQVTELTKEVTITAIDVSSLPLIFNGVEWTERFGGCYLTTRLTLAETGGSYLVPTGLGLIDYSEEPLDNGLTIINLKFNADEEWPILTEYEQDPILQSLITVTSQVVDPPMSAPTATPGTIIRYTPIDKYKSLKITTVYALPDDYTEARSIGFRYPGRIVQLLNVVNCGTIGESFPARELFTSGTVAVSFATSYAEPTPPVNFQPSYLSINGGVPAEGLTDGGVTVYMCAGESTVTSASIPSATDYQALVDAASSFVAHSRCELWKAGLWRTEVTSIPYL